MTSFMPNIEMDHYGFTSDRLATAGIGPCICFVVILDYGKEVFVEHRSDAFLPQIFELTNTSLVFQNLAEHVEDVLPTSKISMVLIIGGNGDQQRFVDMQTYINNLIQDGYDGIDDDVSAYYHQLLNSIKWNNVCFNRKYRLERFTAQTNINVVVEKSKNENERQVTIVQHMDMLGGPVLLIGVLAFNTKTNEQTFAVNESETNHQRDQSMEAFQLANKAVQDFQSHATAFGAIKLEGSLALEMLNHGRCLSAQIDKHFFKDQKELTTDDQEMCQSVFCLGSDEGENDDTIDDF